MLYQRSSCGAHSCAMHAHLTPACLPPRRFVAAFDELNHQALFLLRELRRPPHNLPGGKRGVLSWLLPPTHADSHLIFTHTGHAYASIHNYTCLLLCAQMRGRDDHRPGQGFSIFLSSCAYASGSRWQTILNIHSLVSRLPHILVTSLSRSAQIVSVRLCRSVPPRANFAGAGQSTYDDCDSIVV